MTLRNRFLITAAVLCHLLLASTLVTSQLPPADEAAGAPRTGAEQKSASTETPCARAAAAQKEIGNVDTICAIQQEEQGSIYKLHGAVEIYYGSYVLRADEATYNSDTKEAAAGLTITTAQYLLDLPAMENPVQFRRELRALGIAIVCESLRLQDSYYDNFAPSRAVPL